MTEREIKRTFAVDYALRFIGTFYHWGGDDPSGFDCSGLINEVLQAVGIIDRKEDLTARQLYERFSENISELPYQGCLVFYGKDAENINHVEMLVNEYLTIGAMGGGSKTLTNEDAIRDNAYIKVRPLFSRKDIVAILDPFWDIKEDDI